MKSSPIALALAVTAVGVSAEAASYVTEYYDECSTLPTSTVIDTVIHNWCPDCEGGSGAYTPHVGVLTTYTTVYSQVCSTGWEPKTFTVTEPCTQPGQDRAPTHIPQGFVETTVTCHVCAETPVVAVITSPVPAPLPPGAGKTPATIPAVPTPAGGYPGGQPPVTGGSAPPAGVPPPAGATPVTGGVPPPGAPVNGGSPPPGAPVNGGSPPPGAPVNGESPPVAPINGGSPPGTGAANPPADVPSAGVPVSGGSPPATGGSNPPPANGASPPAGVKPPAVGGSNPSPSPARYGGGTTPAPSPGSDTPADSPIVAFTGMASSNRSIGMSLVVGLIGVMSAVVYYAL